MKRRSPPRCQASALILVLWALLVLSAAVFAWAAVVQDGLLLHSEGNRGLEARAMAYSGVALGMHPLVTRLTPLPEETVTPGQSYRVRLVSEGAKLNLNWLISGEDPKKLTLLRRWLEARGLNFQQREVFVDCLLDYVDGDDVHRLNGREAEKDYRPANRELQSVSELAQVAGAAPLVDKPGWDDELTLHSQGPIDVSSADIEILRLLPGLSEPRLQQFLQMRKGKDGLDGTEDDYVFPNMAAVQQFLGLSQAQFAEISDLISLNDPTLRIVSVGMSGKVARQVEVVVRKGGNKPQILLWKE